MSEQTPTFSERMRAQARNTWDRILDHRFFRAIADDTLEDRVFARYLRIEYGFVDTAAIALGYAVAKAPSFGERRHLAVNLHGLVMDQEQFFAAAFDQIGASADQRTGLPVNGLSAPLHTLFLEVAEKEGYEEILACVLAAEWMYLTWCSRANATPSRRPILSDWVALHAAPPFAGGVAWVRGEIDARGPGLSSHRQARLAALFDETLAAEIRFHDAAYE